VDTQSSTLLLESSRHPTNILDPVTETINNRTEPSQLTLSRQRIFIANSKTCLELNAYCVSFVMLKVYGTKYIYGDI
jgi:hypothetical protein